MPENPSVVQHKLRWRNPREHPVHSVPKEHLKCFPRLPFPSTERYLQGILPIYLKNGFFKIRKIYIDWKRKSLIFFPIPLQNKVWYMQRLTQDGSFSTDFRCDDMIVCQAKALLSEKHYWTLLITLAAPAQLLYSSPTASTGTLFRGTRHLQCLLLPDPALGTSWKSTVLPRTTSKSKRLLYLSLLVFLVTFNFLICLLQFHPELW